MSRLLRAYVHYFKCRCAASTLIANRRFFMKYMHAIGQHERLSLANGLLLVQMVQPGGQVENRFAGDARCSKKKKDIRNSNLNIENRMPTHLTNIRIIEYSGTALIA